MSLTSSCVVISLNLANTTSSLSSPPLSSSPWPGPVVEYHHSSPRGHPVDTRSTHAMNPYQNIIILIVIWTSVRLKLVPASVIVRGRHIPHTHCLPHPYVVIEYKWAVIVREGYCWCWYVFSAFAAMSAYHRLNYYKFIFKLWHLLI